MNHIVENLEEAIITKFPSGDFGLCNEIGSQFLEDIKKSCDEPKSESQVLSKKVFRLMD